MLAPPEAVKVRVSLLFIVGVAGLTVIIEAAALGTVGPKGLFLSVELHPRIAKLTRRSAPLALCSIFSFIRDFLIKLCRP